MIKIDLITLSMRTKFELTTNIVFSWKTKSGFRKDGLLNTPTFSKFRSDNRKSELLVDHFLYLSAMMRFILPPTEA